MRKTIIKLVTLSITLLLSISGIVLGEENNTPTIGETDGANTTNETGEQNITDETTDGIQIDDTPLSTSEDLDVPEEYPPSDEDDHEKPVETTESPGFGSVASIIILLSAAYITMRR